MSSKVLVTGAAGLVGNAVCKLLEACGRTVIALDRIEADAGSDRIVLCDLADLSQLDRIIRNSQVDQIVHCGAVSGPMLALDNPAAIITTNVLGTGNVLEAARRNSVSRFVFCSSTSAIGNTAGGRSDERTLLRPTSVYGASKAAGEHLVEAYRARYGLDCVILRLSWIYGPHRRTDCVIRRMISDALTGKATRLGHGRNFYRQFVYIEDAVRALNLTLERKSLPHSVYTITGGSYLTIGEVADVVRRVLPTANIIVEEGDDPLDDRQGEFDISSAVSDLGFSPQVSLGDGVRLYAEWLRSELVIYD